MGNYKILPLSHGGGCKILPSSDGGVGGVDFFSEQNFSAKSYKYIKNNSSIIL